jgi:hypothetical protein
MLEKLPVVVEVDDIAAPSDTHTGGVVDKGFFKSLEPVNLVPAGAKRIETKPLDVDKIKANLEAFCKTVNGMLEDIEEVGKFKLTEITLSVEISSEGGIELIGTAKVGGKGAVELKFTK